MSHGQVPQKLKAAFLALHVRLRQMLSTSQAHYSTKDKVTVLVASARQLARAAVTTEQFLEVVIAILEFSIEKLSLEPSGNREDFLAAADENTEEVQELLKRCGFYQFVMRDEMPSEMDLILMINAIMERALESESVEYLLLLERIQFPCDGFEIAGHSIVQSGQFQMALDPDVCKDFFPDEELGYEGWALIEDGGRRARAILTGQDDGY